MTTKLRLFFSKKEHDSKEFNEYFLILRMWKSVNEMKKFSVASSLCQSIFCVVRIVVSFFSDSVNQWTLHILFQIFLIVFVYFWTFRSRIDIHRMVSLDWVSSEHKEALKGLYKSYKRLFKQPEKIYSCLFDISKYIGHACWRSYIV